MSRIGTLSHAYAKWNDYLNQMNSWLFDLRKMKDGLIPAKQSVNIPDDVRFFLNKVAETFDPSSSRVTSAIPLSIKKQLQTQLAGQSVTPRLLNLLQTDALLLDDISDEDISMLLTVVLSLDSEVTSLHHQMHRYR